MKKFILLFILVIMTANVNRLNARTVYGWFGYTVELPDDATYQEIQLAAEILNLLCDIDEYGEPDEPIEPREPDDPDGPGDPD